VRHGVRRVGLTALSLTMGLTQQTRITQNHPTPSTS
jgi:hypothetical protein